MKKLNVGIVGLGHWALETHIPFLLRSEFVGIIYGCDIDFSGKEIDDRIIKVDLFEELLNCDINAIIISTPHYLHYKYTKECLMRGIHVHVDKPLAESYKEAEELRSIAEKKNLILNTHTQKKYQKGIKEIIRYAKTNQELSFVSGSIWQPKFQDYPNSWRSDFKSSIGGILMDSGFHIVDTILYIVDRINEINVNEIKDIRAFFDTDGKSNDNFSALTFRIYKTIVQVNAFRGVPVFIKKEEYQIFGPETYIGVTYSKEFDKKAYMIGVFRSNKEITKEKRLISAIDSKFQPLNSFFKAISGNEKSKVSVRKNVQISLLTLKIIEEAYKQL